VINVCCTVFPYSRYPVYQVLTTVFSGLGMGQPSFRYDSLIKYYISNAVQIIHTTLHRALWNITDATAAMILRPSPLS